MVRAIVKQIALWCRGVLLLWSLTRHSRGRAAGSNVPHWTSRNWAEDVRVLVRGDVNVRYLDYGTGPTLVLLHGMGCCWQWWLECIPTLALTNRVIAIDTPGFGDSSRLPGPVFMRDYAKVVADVLADAGAPGGTLVGHSMGGLIAIEVAQRYPELVDDLVLMDSGGVPMSERRLEIVLAALRGARLAFSNPVTIRLLVASRLARRIFLRGAMRDPDAMSDELAAVVVPKLGAPGFPEAITSSAIAVRDCEPEAIEQPTLLIWGECDMFAPLQTAQDMVARLPNGR